jgi:hypothetical protein
MAAELDCEAARALLAADYVSRTQSGDVEGFTLASIGAAAITTVLSVFLSTREASAPAQETAAISGGVVTAGLAVVPLYVHPRIAFAHPRNLLADIWRGGATSAIYPAFVWGYLSRAAFSNDQKAPIRTKIVNRWRAAKRLESDPAAAGLLFGAGGSYDDEALRLRAAMLAEVRIEVELANQDLAALRRQGSW